MSVIENHPLPTTSGLAIESLRVRNFKAIRDSGDVTFTPLTVLIGNNGVGKSSLIEALEMIRRLSGTGINGAIQQWFGFEYILNAFASSSKESGSQSKNHQSSTMSFEIHGSSRMGFGQYATNGNYSATSELAMRPATKTVFYVSEMLEQMSNDGPRRVVTRTKESRIVEELGTSTPFRVLLRPDESVLSGEPSMFYWQFVRLEPDVIGQQNPPRSSDGLLPLSPNGSNAAEYILDIKLKYPRTLDGIIETIQVILPYIADIQPVVSQGIGRRVQLQFQELGKDLPGWLMSTGTLRLVALLALFRNPTPPPLIVIEEIENGLDPRTISLIVEEIRELVRSGRSQVIMTTHSPYLLDLLPLESMIFVERVDGQPRFTRPADDEDVVRWREDFAPGRLYTMGRFRAKQ